MDQSQQLELNLFPDPSFAQILREKEVHGFLSVFTNNRMKRGWSVSFNRNSGTRTLTIPSHFDHAPESIKRALIHWAILPFPRTRKEKVLIKSKRSELEHHIRQYMMQSGHVKPQISRINRSSLIDKTQGIKFDLKTIFDLINDKYFNNTISSYVRWGTRGSTTSYQTIRTSADGTRWNLITIAGVYNHPKVPQFALESVMYHEMLHIKIPPFRRNGKNVIHGKEFRDAERQFPYYELWMQWEKAEVRSIARELKRKR